MSLKHLALKRIKGELIGEFPVKTEGELLPPKATKKFTLTRSGKRLKTKPFITGYQCTCGSISYFPNGFRWKDLKGKSHLGFICCQCKTRYNFV